MRILVSNDDGVFAPGLAALALGLLDTLGAEHDLTVVAPLTDHSGAAAAVGTVHDRESIPFETVDIPGLRDVPVYGVDGPPALAALLACIGGFGGPPDLVVSGINHGINTGRSALHSGTVGVALTAAQFDISGLAVSIAWGDDPVPWETPVSLASRIIPALAAQPGGTVLNLNVPAVRLANLRGLRHGTLGKVGLIRGVREERSPAPVTGTAVDPTAEAVTLTLRGSGTDADRRAEHAEMDPGSDAALLAAGWAALTPLVGVREDTSEEGQRAVADGLATFETA